MDAIERASLPHSRLAQLALLALIPVLGFYPVETRAEVNLVEEYVYVAEESPVLEPNLEIAQDLYKEWSKPKKPRSVAKTSPQDTGYNICSCVSYARYRTGINVGSIGVARNHPVNSQTPKVGAILITYESSAGHASVVVGFDSEYVYVDEANYSRCKLTKGRAIRLNSKLIKGYYY